MEVREHNNDAKITKISKNLKPQAANVEEKGGGGEEEPTFIITCGSMSRKCKCPPPTI